MLTKIILRVRENKLKVYNTTFNNRLDWCWANGDGGTLDGNTDLALTQTVYSFAALKWVIIGLDNGLSSFQSQTII